MSLIGTTLPPTTLITNTHSHSHKLLPLHTHTHTLRLIHHTIHTLRRLFLEVLQPIHLKRMPQILRNFRTFDPSTSQLVPDNEPLHPYPLRGRVFLELPQKHTGNEARIRALIILCLEVYTCMHVYIWSASRYVIYSVCTYSPANTESQEQNFLEISNRTHH